MKEFVYLGSRLSNKCDEESEIEWRLLKGNKCAEGLNRYIGARKIFRSIKERVYKTIIRPTVVYGRKAWVLNKKLEEKLLKWETKILKRIYIGKKVGEGYERKK